MYFEDLSPYTYLVGGGRTLPSVKNVGWLARGEPFPRGTTDKSMLDKLKDLCSNPDAAVNQTRGFHECPFCMETIDLQYNGQQTPLGSAEIWVTDSNGTFYAAPDLVVHYVEAHGYMPPAEFMNALRWTWEHEWCEGDQLRERLVDEVHKEQTPH